MRCVRVATCTALVAALVACGDAKPVAWNDPQPVMNGAGVLALDDSGNARFVPAPPLPPSLPAEPMCPGTASVAWASARGVYAAWWTPRHDSTVVLRASYSADSGHTWRASSAADTNDIEVAGCARAAPSIAVSGDYVHLAYSMKAPEGTGVFLSHSMDGGKLFHSPVPIVYGDRLTTVAIAADGDRVAVAYEDPNSSPTAITLALSRTMGHIFEVHVPVSSGDGDATQPRVALRGNTVAVAWRTSAPDDTVHAHAGLLVRTGTIR